MRLLNNSKFLKTRNDIVIYYSLSEYWINEFSSKTRFEIEAACASNDNNNRKRKRGKKHEKVETTFKEWFAAVREKDAGS